MKIKPRRTERIEQDAKKKQQARKFKTVFILILMILLLLAGVVYIRLYPAQQATQMQSEFNATWTEENYAGAMEIYSKIQQKSLEKSGFFNQPHEFEILKLDTESMIFAEIDDILNRIRSEERPSLSDREIDFLSGVQGLAVARLAGALQSISGDVLNGDLEPSRADAMFAALEASGLIQDQIAEFRENIEQMELVQLRFSEAVRLDGSNDKLAAALKMREILDDKEVVKSGFAYEQTTLLYNSMIDELKPVLLEDLSIMIENDRIFTANSFLSTLRKLYPDDVSLAAYEQDVRRKIPEDLVQWRGQVVHLVVHPLITNPEEAFDGDQWAKNADLNRLTSKEFSAMLKQLYDQDYILISESSLLKTDGSFKTISLPQGKKPVILTVMGLSYPITVRRQGTAERLVYDAKSDLVLCEYVDESGNEVIDEGGEAVCILNQFVKEHPEFAFDGARGTIAIRSTYDIFGYVTSQEQADASAELAKSYSLVPESIAPDSFADNTAKVGKIANRLMEQGWDFASYGHSSTSISAMTIDEVQEQIANWRVAVGARIADTRIFVYPNNDILPGTDERSVALQEEGFRIFNGIGPKPYLYHKNNYIYMDCQLVSGSILRGGRLSWLLRAEDIYDGARPRSLGASD